MLALPVIMVACGVTEDAGPISGGLTWQSAVLCTWKRYTARPCPIMLLETYSSVASTARVPLGRIMSQNAYSVYIIHPSCHHPAAYLVRNIALDPLLKWALVAPIAVALCFMGQRPAVWLSP